MAILWRRLPSPYAFAYPLTLPGIHTLLILPNEHAMLALCASKYQWIYLKTMQKPLLVLAFTK